MDESFEVVKLDQRPCCVHYLECFDVFLVGTYQLLNSIEDARAKSRHLDAFSKDELESYLIKINSRLGNFAVIKQDNDEKFKCVSKFECEESGGVFDFILSKQSEDTCEIFAAHSNGTFGIYNLEQRNCTELDLTALSSVDVPEAKMLTCIDKFPDERCLVAVGDSEGSLSLIANEQVVLQKLCDTTNPIWQVRCINMVSGKRIIIVGTETSSWCIFELKNAWDVSQRKLEVIYKHSSDVYNPGITCIVRMSCDIGALRNNQEAFRILVGSYDETLTCYQLVFGDGQREPKVEFVSVKNLTDGGVWRVKQIPPSRKSIARLYVAAMYAGSFKLVSSGPEEGFDFESLEPKQLLELASPMFSEKPLHYDIDFSPLSSACCIADFNNSLCVIKYDR